MKKKEEYCLYF